MDTAFFWLSKLAWLVIAPESVLVLLVLASWVLLARGSAKWGKRVLGVVAAGMLILTFLPVGEWVLYPLEARFEANPALPQKVAGIIVLGGAEDAERSAAWDQVEVNDSAERFFASVTLARRYPEAKLLFTSGSGSALDQKFKGAAVAARLYGEAKVFHRAARMKQMAVLYREANGGLEAKYKLAEYLSANSERIYFNALLWSGFQRYALYADTDSRLTREERQRLTSGERQLKDDQEELWRAHLLLREVVRESGQTVLGRRAARLAIQCVRQISDRFGRENEIRAADLELSRWLGRS